MLTDREVYEYHGYKEQCKHITSEMHELTSAIQEYELNYGKDGVYINTMLDNICEEIADVEFMLNQIKEYYELQQQIINDWGRFKRKREDKRIKEGYYEQNRKQSTRGDNLLSKEE